MICNQELAEKITDRLIWKSRQSLSISLVFPILGEKADKLISLINILEDTEEMDYWADFIRTGVERAILKVLDEFVLDEKIDDKSKTS